MGFFLFTGLKFSCIILSYSIPFMFPNLLRAWANHNLILHVIVENSAKKVKLW